MNLIKKCIVCIQSKDTENALNNTLKIMKDVVISLIEKKVTTHIIRAGLLCTYR